MNPRGFHSITLGCKLNQFDTAAIEGELSRRGYAPEDDPARAAVVVVNTCTVTAKADAEARKRIRNVRRNNPHCRLLVTGCYAEREAETLAALDGVDRVFGNRDKPRLGTILDGMGIAAEGPDAKGPAAGDRGCDGSLALPPALHFGERSRAFLRIQEGCRLACSYCVIPTVRGPSRSVEPDEVVGTARRLWDAGYREIVLTGVNTGDYGKDLDPRTDLAGLLERLLEAAGPNRIRLNSLEPLTVTDRIVALMAADPRLAPHLQIPLQSGSESILRGMRRNYRLATYTERVDRLRESVPHVGLGADVIVGFPAESEERFEETYRFIEESPLHYLHVFAWSARPGTPAAELPERVHGSRIRERSRRLHALAAHKSLRFRRSFIGRRLDAVVLGPGRDEERVRALTGNFIEVALPAGAARRGELVEVKIVAAAETATRAVVTGIPDWAADRTAGPGAPTGEGGVRPAPPVAGPAPRGI